MRDHLFPKLTLALALGWAMTGCATVGPPVATPAPGVVPRGVVLAVDGAGGFHGTSAALSQAVRDTRLPLIVETVPWSHGYGRALADQVDYEWIREAGQCLAGRVAALRAASPDCTISLVGHSAGSAVVLAAADELPADSVDRILLLAPSVSADYDLRPALRCARRGIDVFASDRDWAYLGVGTALVGTADRHWTADAAGRTGFRPMTASADDACLYARLRQHAWDPCVVWTGNHGGHYGAYQPGYLRAYVLPLLQADLSPTR